jgi:hypothetical protein
VLEDLGHNAMLPRHNQDWTHRHPCIRPSTAARSRVRPWRHDHLFGLVLDPPEFERAAGQSAKGFAPPLRSVSREPAR